MFVIDCFPPPFKLHGYCVMFKKRLMTPTRPLEILDEPALVDALAEYTARYTKMLAEGGKEKEILNCRETIQSLIDEIEYRKKPLTSGEPAGKKPR
jgi:hypothetical protein